MRFPTALGSILDLIGETPLIAMDRLMADSRSKLFVKLESANPGLSVKDRPALQILRDAEREGKIHPPMTIIERTSGNMGTGLAIACTILGYKLVVVMSEGNSVERRQVLAALGAEVVTVPQVTGCPGQVTGEDLKRVEEVTNDLQKKLGAFRGDQFKNPSSVKAHELGTGPEIWKQCGGTLDAFVSVVGSSGTFVGVSRFLKKQNPAIKCYAVEPSNATVLSGGIENAGLHRLQGVGYADIPYLWEPELADGFIPITDHEAAHYARLLATKEGIMAGFTSGANVAAARRIGESSTTPLNIVTVITDSGLKYLSTDLFSLPVDESER